MSAVSSRQVELTGLLSAYVIAADDEEDKAAALYQATQHLERAMRDGAEKAMSRPHEHPRIVQARNEWWYAQRLEANARKEWEQALNRYLQRDQDAWVCIRLNERGRFYPAERHNGAWLQLRTFDRPDTDFPTLKQAVLWLHHQFLEHRPGFDTLLSLWPTAELHPPASAQESASA